MAERFNLTAQLQLQAPTNTQQVINQIRGQLKGGLNANVNINANTKALAQVNSGLQGASKGAKAASRDIGVLNRNLSEAARRFGVITLATGTMLSFAQAVKRAVGDAIAFERELVKISQVTGQTVKQLTGLTSEITKLSTGLGVSSASLLQVSRVLAQAGFSARDTTQALDILAKTTLGPTFDDISQTVEGAIAVLRQFSKEAAQAGGNIKFLESTLDSINAVSKNFAVESGDLITVIRRVGGVFAAAGGEVNELIALFTSVRATTRESAETIATGLRTIFTRIQRTETVNQLEALGISLRDAQGQFVGAFEAVNRLAVGLSALDPRDYRFSDIVEQLGGFRQIGKVIPLIQQFAVAQDALNVAQAANGSVTADAITAQQSLAVQAAKVREEFSALIRQLTDSSSFRSIASGALELARALIRIGEALEPVLPLLTSFLALKVGQGLAPGLSALVGVRRKSHGGIIHRAAGGYVPGTGNRDTVPAMLTPGEFVIKKSSAAKLGPDTLNAMNNNRFNRGTTLADINRMQSDIGSGTIALKGKKDAGAKILGTMRLAKSKAQAAADEDSYGAAFLRPVGVTGDFDGGIKKGEMTKLLQGSVGFKALSGLSKRFPEIKKQADDVVASYANRNTFSFRAGSLGNQEAANLEGIIYNGVLSTVEEGVGAIGQKLGIRGNIATAAALKQANIDQTVGNIFESILTFGGAPYDPNTDRAANAPFDFPRGLGGDLAGKFGALAPERPTDAKASYNQDAIQSVIGKIRATLFRESERELDPILTAAASAIQQQTGGDPLTADKTQIKKLTGATTGARAAKAAKRKGLNSGGKADTVPALLTPGEFVINKSSAQSIGYANLNKMNQTGVAKFNAGGGVGIRKYANGTGPNGVEGFPSPMANADLFSGDYDFASDAQATLEELESRAEAAADALEIVAKSAGNAAAAGGGGGPPDGPDPPDYNDLNDKIAVQVAAAKRSAQVTEESISSTEKLSEAQKKFEQEKKKAILVEAKHLKSVSTGLRGDQILAKAKENVAARYSSLDPALIKNITTAKTFSQKMAETFPTFAKMKASAPGAIQSAGQVAAGAGRGLAQGAANLGGIAQAAQSFVFLGSAAAALGSQFGGLSEETSKAVSETAAYASSIVGIGGTVTQLFSSLGQAVTAETVASGASAGADQQEAQASSAAATASSKAAQGIVTGFALGAAAAAAISTAFKFYAAQARAQADKLSKDIDQSLKAVEAGESGGAGVSRQVLQEVDARSQAQALDRASSSALSGGLAGAAGGAVVGAAVGSIIPVIGTAIGAGIGGLFGGVVGALTSASAAYGEEINKLSEASGRLAPSLRDTAEGLVAVIKAQRDFSQALSDIDIEENLTPEERTSRRLEATDQAGGQFVAANQQAISALNALSQTTEAGGKGLAQLTKEDFDEAPALAAQFELAKNELERSQKGLAQAVSESRKTLSEAAKQELTGEVSFDEAIASGGQFSQAFKSSQDAIKAEAEARINLLRIQAATASSTEEREALNKAANQAQRRLSQQLKDQENGYRRLAEEAKAAAESQKELPLPKSNTGDSY